MIFLTSGHFACVSIWLAVRMVLKTKIYFYLKFNINWKPMKISKTIRTLSRIFFLWKRRNIIFVIQILTWNLLRTLYFENCSTKHLALSWKVLIAGSLQQVRFSISSPFLSNLRPASRNNNFFLYWKAKNRRKVQILHSQLTLVVV